MNTLHLTALVALALPCAAQSADELAVGHWVRLKGELAADGVFRVSEVEALAPAEQNALVGTVARQISPARFELLGQEVHVSATTRWRGISAGDLAGARVKVEGDYHGSRKLSADSISRRDAGRDAIEGRIDRLERAPDGVRVTVLRWTAWIAKGTSVVSDKPLRELPLAPLREFPQTPDARRDEDDATRGTLRLGDVVIGGQLEYKHDAIREQDLNEARDDDRDDREPSARIEGVWQPDESLFLLASVRLRDGRRIDQDDPDEHESKVLLNESYAYWRDAFGSGWDVQGGRQDFDERREWLYDQNLDALRLVRSSPELRAELSVSSSLSDAGRRDEHSTNWIAYVSNNDLDRHLAAFVVSRHTSDGGYAFDTELQPRIATHVGARAYGEWLPDTDAWLELAWLGGRTDEVDPTTLVVSEREVSAFGFDAGATWQPWRDGPRFTLAYAWGQGGSDAGSSFRQTGLHDNTDEFGGETSFQYYGELLDPELANLSVVTLGVGQEIAPRTSLDLVLHRYAQDEPRDRLIDTGLRKRPDGVHDELGIEVDAVLGCRAVDDWLLESVVAWFDPGDAFPGADDAWLFRLQVRYKF